MQTLHRYPPNQRIQWEGGGGKYATKISEIGVLLLKRIFGICEAWKSHQ